MGTADYRLRLAFDFYLATMPTESLTVVDQMGLYFQIAGWTWGSLGAIPLGRC